MNGGAEALERSRGECRPAYQADQSERPGTRGSFSTTSRVVGRSSYSHARVNAAAACVSGPSMLSSGGDAAETLANGLCRFASGAAHVSATAEAKP